MDAFLMHLDEELINERPGRHYGAHSLLERGRYTPRELAFWINFYALFYDTLFMPPNFLTDNRLTVPILMQLGADDPNSLIRSIASPLRIYWEDRWPATFEALVRQDWNSDESATAQTSMSSALEIARRCELVFSGRIDYGTIDMHLDRMHSIKELKGLAFTDRNAADLRTPRSALMACIEAVESRPLGEGYGRNLFYAMFGYFRNDRPARQQTLQEQFQDILSPYLKAHPYFAHEFLMCLDYVSNTLKAKRASHLLRRDLKLLMPADYYDGVRRARYDDLPTTLRAAPEDSVFVDPDAVIALSPRQLESIRRLTQRTDFAAAFANLERSKDAKTVAACEQALGTYLRGIGGVLHPAAARVSESAIALRPACRLLGPGVGFAFVWCGAERTVVAGASVGGVAVGLMLEKGLDAIADRTKPASPIPVSQIALSEEVRVNLER